MPTLVGMFQMSVGHKNFYNIVLGMVNKCSNFHEDWSLQKKLVRRQISYYLHSLVLCHLSLSRDHKNIKTFSAKSIIVTLENQSTYKSIM